MSADNGVYILKTKDQYRVAHLHAIDNITWSVITGNETLTGGYVPTRVVEMWGECKYTRSRKTAYDIAHRMEMRLPVCEYGICMINLDKTWKNILRDAEKYAKLEIEFLKKSREKNILNLNLLQKMADGNFG